jgi:hypothetical protein
MSRRFRDPASHIEQGRPRRERRGTSATASPPDQLPPAKRRIAEALAALLVAHYRRQQEPAEREGFPEA